MFYNKPTRANGKHLAKDGVLLLELNRTRFVPVCPGKQPDTKRVRFDSGVIVNALAETQKAYLAGLIDGEGCVAITKSFLQKTQKHSYRLCFYVVMTSEAMVRYCHELTGIGSVHLFPRHEKNNHHRDQWQWALSKHDTIDLLVQVLPYLRLKKQQAELAVEFGTVVDPGRRFGNTVPPALLEQREAYYLAIKNLKWDKSPAML